MLKIKKLSDQAILPVRANSTDAGIDLSSPIDAEIPAHTSVLIPFGFAMEIPVGTAGMIYARSSLGSFHGIRPRNCVGVIDAKYRGEVMIALENHSAIPYYVNRGDRIAQMVLTPVFMDVVVEVDELDMSGDRGGGFGSTGK